MKTRFAIKRKAKDKKKRLGEYQAKLMRKRRKISAWEKISYIDFLMLTAIGDISPEEAHDFLHKRYFSREIFNAKIGQLASLYSGFEDLPVEGNLPESARPAILSKWSFSRKIAHFKGPKIPVPDYRMGHAESFKIIKELIDKNFCKFRILEFAIAVLKIEPIYIITILNRMRPQTPAYISTRRYEMLKREETFQRFYREGRRHHAIALSEGRIKSGSGDRALFDQKSMDGLLPGFLSNCVKLLKYPYYITNLIMVDRRWFIDIYLSSGSPQITVKL